MQIVNFYKRHQNLIQVLLFPLVLMVFDTLVLTILNLGVYFGSFIRGVFELVL